MLNKKIIKCDLCVIGGGMAGMAAAIAAAREGIQVVLMHERPVLGGNASSEIRMWICGAKGEDNRETGILEEIALENYYRNPTKSYAIWDTVLYDFIRREKNITLLLNCTCMDADTIKDSFSYGRNRKIKSVTGYQMTTQTFYQVEAKYYCDSSGDSILAPLCDAEFMLGREADYQFGEDTYVKEPDKMTMGMSCLIQAKETLQDIEYIPPEWSYKLSAKDFENKKTDLNNTSENFWYLELGGDKNTIDDTEILRDELICLATGTWDHIKNSGDFDSKKWDLDFLGFLPGKRESRRMCGEYIITQKDISGGKVFDDEIAYGGWILDDHYPGGFFQKGQPNTTIPTPAPYSIPYRSLYSKNVDNLFFAGRNISMTHTAMSSIRVMATCTLLGAAVGKAASIATKNDYTPHDVYLKSIEKLQSLLTNDDYFLPSKVRKVSDFCKKANLSINNNVIRNGQDRFHTIYNNENHCYYAKEGEQIIYSFDKQKINSIHLTFDSDLSRQSIPGIKYQKTLMTKSNSPLDYPQVHMPDTLCKEFTLFGEADGEIKEILSVNNNRKRYYHLNLSEELEKIILVPKSTWGKNDTIPIISFDFN